MKTLILALGLAAALASPAAAHHSFAMFDLQGRASVRGTVKEVQWGNPHVWIEVMVAGPGGQGVQYSFEGGAIANLKRAGWTRDTLKPGDQVTVATYPFKSGQKGGALLSVTLADGRVLQGGAGNPQQTVPLPPGI